MKDDLIGSHLLDLTNIKCSQEREMEISTTNTPTDSSEDSNPPILVASLNLLAIPASDCVQTLAPSKSNTLLFPPSSPGPLRRRKLTGSNTNSAILSVAIIEGKILIDETHEAREIYLKLKLGTESFRSNVVKLGPNPKWLEATEMFIPDVSNCPELELKLKDSKAKELGRYLLIKIAKSSKNFIFKVNYEPIYFKKGKNSQNKYGIGELLNISISG